MRRNLKLYWHTRTVDGRQNLGDGLSPIVCERLSGMCVVYSRVRHCDLMAIGSILQRAKPRWFRRPIHVWGTGLIKEQAVVGGGHCFHAARGRLTAERIRGGAVSVCGDPALLCGQLFSTPRSPKRYSVGLIPHYADQGHPLVKSFVDRARRATVIDILVRDASEETQSFLKRVSECEVVLSSSLHGLILADSLGVPNAWVCFSDRLVGQAFKFRDYYSAFGISSPEPFPLSSATTEAEALDVAAHYSRPGLERLQQALFSSFPFPHCAA